jgi:hypothetical protein
VTVTATSSAVLEERLHELLVSISRVSRAVALNDDKQLRAVRMVNGYIKLLANRIPAILPAVLQQFSSALILQLELESVREEEEPRAKKQYMITTGQYVIDVGSQVQYPMMVFRHFRDQRICRALRTTCELLALHGDPVFLIDHFREALENRSSRKVRCQLLIILSSIVKGAVKIPRGTAVSLADVVLEVSAETEFEGTTQRDSLGALVAECIGVVCSSVDPESFRILLPTIFYPILELLGEGMDLASGAMAQAAIVTLKRLAVLCGKAADDVKGLIESNADYVVDSLSRKMAESHRYPNAPNIFRALLRLTGNAFLPFIEDTIHQVLRGLEKKEQASTESYVRVLRDVVAAMHGPSAESVP